MPRRENGAGASKLRRSSMETVLRASTWGGRREGRGRGRGELDGDDGERERELDEGRLKAHMGCGQIDSATEIEDKSGLCSAGSLILWKPGEQQTRRTRAQTHFGTISSPNLPFAWKASFHLSTHKHHLHPSCKPGNP